MGTEKKTIMVTGSAGFIGFNLSRELLERGHNVVGVDNFNDYYAVELKRKRSEILKKYDSYNEQDLDLCDLDGLDKLFKSMKIDKVCNLAAQAGVRYSLEHPHTYERCNLQAFLNVLEMVRHHDVERIVYASSSSVYGGNTKVPFSESDNVDSPVSLYAATKKANELIAHSYSHLYGFQSIGLRFFSVYGPWGRPDMALWIFTENICNGKKIKVFNHGNMRRDFTYVDDIVNGVCASLFNDNLEKYEIFNLGNHRSEQLMKMISVIEDELGMKADMEMLPMQPGDVPESFADIDKARAKLGYEPKTPIEIGIPNFIKWYKEHSDIAAKVFQGR